MLESDGSWASLGIVGPREKGARSLPPGSSHRAAEYSCAVVGLLSTAGTIPQPTVWMGPHGLVHCTSHGSPEPPAKVGWPGGASLGKLIPGLFKLLSF